MALREALLAGGAVVAAGTHTMSAPNQAEGSVIHAANAPSHIRTHSVRRLSFTEFAAKQSVAAATGPEANASSDNTPQACLSSALQAPPIDAPVKVRGMDSIPIHVHGDPVIDDFRNPDACVGDRKVEVRGVATTLTGKRVPFSKGDKDGWITVADTNGSFDVDVTIPLRRRLGSPKLPNGRSLHCTTPFELEVRNTAHENGLSDSSTSPFFFSDKFCTKAQMRHALEHARAQQRQHRRQQQAHRSQAR